MPALFSLVLIAALAALAWQLARRQDARRKAAPGKAGYLEYRTDLAFDECLDRLETAAPEDLFAYECPRQPDGSFVLHFTLHNPTNQPLDTLFTLRMDTGRQTILTLHFVREAFGYREPVFPEALLDEFMNQKFTARRTK